MRGMVDGNRSPLSLALPYPSSERLRRPPSPPRGEGSDPPVRPAPVPERQPAPVPQDLQLLPDLGPHIVVARIQRRQPPLLRIHLGQHELGPPDRLHRPHDGQQPAARLQAFVAQEQGGGPGGADLGLRYLDTGTDQGDAAGDGDVLEPDGAALPAGAAGVGAQRRARSDDRLGEEMARHDDQLADAMRRAVVAHDEQAGIVGRRQPLLHGPPRPGGQHPGDGALSGLELIFLAAGGAAEVADAGVVGQGRQAIGRTGGTEAVLGHPALGQMASLLRPALVDGGGLGEAELAPVIVVLPHSPTVAGGGSGGIVPAKGRWPS